MATAATLIPSITTPILPAKKNEPLLSVLSMGANKHTVTIEKAGVFRTWNNNHKFLNLVFTCCSLGVYAFVKLFAYKHGVEVVKKGTECYLVSKKVGNTTLKQLRIKPEDIKIDVKNSELTENQLGVVILQLTPTVAMNVDDASQVANQINAGKVFGLGAEEGIHSAATGVDIAWFRLFDLTKKIFTSTSLQGRTLTDLQVMCEENHMCNLKDNFILILSKCNDNVKRQLSALFDNDVADTQMRTPSIKREDMDRIKVALTVKK